MASNQGATTKHYVAQIKVEQVEKGGENKRCVSEALIITVKAFSLDRLKEKIRDHTALLDEADL